MYIADSDADERDDLKDAPDAWFAWSEVYRIIPGLGDFEFNQGGMLQWSVISMLWQVTNVSTTWRTCAAATAWLGRWRRDCDCWVRKTAGTPWRGRYGALGRKARCGLFQLDMKVSIRSVLGDLGCGFCQCPGPPCLAARCGLLFHGQMEGRFHFKCTGRYGMSSLIEL